MICDLAEYYHIYDYKKLPPSYLSILVAGLREDSRVYVKIADSKMTTEKMLLSGILDRLSLLVYANTKDAIKGVNKPHLILDSLNEERYREYRSGDDFMKAREKIMKRVRGDNNG